MRIAVVGLGKIGTALAAQYVSKGHVVVGCDINPRTVESINAGRAPMREEPGVQDLIAQGVAAGRLSATTDTTAAVRLCSAVVVVVPLLVDGAKRPDYHMLDGAVDAIAHGLQPQTLVSFETTLPVGDTRARFGPLLERGSGLRAGRDFALAFSPERVKSGQILRDLATYPKVVGGVDAHSARMAGAFYRQVLDAAVIEVASAEVAEFAKLAASFYRDVNIALANELALCAQACGVDVLDAIRVANTEPTSAIHQPGIGVGGHCIPVYPYFFIERYPTTALLRTARETNDAMAAHAVRLLEQAMGPLAGQRVVVLGLAFRANVKEATCSMAFRLVDALERCGATAQVHDPLFSPDELRALGVQPVDAAGLADADAVIIQSYHDQYRSLDFGRLRRCRAVLDGRNALPDDVVAALPCPYLSLGRPILDTPTLCPAAPSRVAVGASREV